MTADDIRHVADGVQWLALATAVLLLLMVVAAGWHWQTWRRPLALVLVYGGLATAFYVATLSNLVAGRRPLQRRPALSEIVMVFVME